jgi:hypothetical protein
MCMAMALAFVVQKDAHLTDRHLNRFIVVPEHKLLFCYIEKVACTSFNRLFNQMRSQPPDGFWFANTPAKHNLSKSALEGLLVDPTWHKAVFYREPLARFLSGYRSKCEPGHDHDTHHCSATFGSVNASFQQAVAAIALMDGTSADKDQVVDEHYQRQARFCGGLENTLRYYDTIELLTKETAHERVGAMLENAGVNKTLPFFNKIFPAHMNSTAAHVTNAEAAESKYYTTTAMANTVMAHYMEDYLLFGISAPEWAVKSLEERIDHSQQ